MGPLEPKAISLCFFSKLVFQGRVGACLAHCALLCLSVLRAGSALGGFAPGKTSELAPRFPISLCLTGTIPLQPPPSAWASLPCSQTLPLSTNNEIQQPGGGHRAVPQSSAGGMGSCSGICSREQWLHGSCLGRMAGHSGSSLWLQSPCGDQQGRLGGLCRALPPKHLMGCLFPSSKYQGSS